MTAWRAAPAHLGLCQLEVTNFDEILDLGHKVREPDASHVKQASCIFGVNWRALSIGVFSLKLGDDLENLRIVGIEALDEIDVELDLLQLVAVCHIPLSVKLVGHARKSFHKSLSLAISLGVRSRRGRASVRSTAHVGRGRWVVGGHCERLFMVCK